MSSPRQGVQGDAQASWPHPGLPLAMPSKRRKEKRGGGHRGQGCLRPSGGRQGSVLRGLKLADFMSLRGTGDWGSLHCFFLSPQSLPSFCSGTCGLSQFGCRCLPRLCAEDKSTPSDTVRITGCSWAPSWGSAVHQCTPRETEYGVALKRQCCGSG